jgi:alkyl hydroperoxide reductase subunit AhpC
MYPLDFTFTCPTEILAFDKKSPEFLKSNCHVLGCSIDSEYVHYNWAKLPVTQGGLKGDSDLKIPLIADITKKIAKDYGALVEEKGIALRANYLIDPKGVLRHISMNDFPVGRSVDEAYRLLKAFQFADEHGEVCPANWQEGSDTIKADVKDSLEYFKKQK